MKITTHLIIAYDPSRFEPDKPYRLWIADNGPVGDKLNVDTNSEHSTFPTEATGRFATIEEAITSYERFLRYVESKIRIVNKKNPKPGGPSWHKWT